MCLTDEVYWLLAKLRHNPINFILACIVTQYINLVLKVAFLMLYKLLWGLNCQPGLTNLLELLQSHVRSDAWKGRRQRRCLLFHWLSCHLLILLEHKCSCIVVVWRAVANSVVKLIVTFICAFFVWVGHIFAVIDCAIMLWLKVLYCLRANRVAFYSWCVIWYVLYLSLDSIWGIYLHVWLSWEVEKDRNDLFGCL